MNFKFFRDVFKCFAYKIYLHSLIRRSNDKNSNKPPIGKLSSEYRSFFAR